MLPRGDGAGELATLILRVLRGGRRRRRRAHRSHGRAHGRAHRPLIRFGGRGRGVRPANAGVARGRRPEEGEPNRSLAPRGCAVRTVDSHRSPLLGCVFGRTTCPPLWRSRARSRLALVLGDAQPMERISAVPRKFPAPCWFGRRYPPAGPMRGDVGFDDEPFTSRGHPLTGKTARTLLVMVAVLAVPYATPKLRSFRVARLPWQAETATVEAPALAPPAAAPTAGEQALPASENTPTVNNALPAEAHTALPEIDPAIRALLAEVEDRERPRARRLLRAPRAYGAPGARRGHAHP